MYVNPIEILGLSNHQHAPSINAEIIKKSKRRLFADIDLSDDCLYDYHGAKITKSICEKSIDELDDNDKKDFYLYLANNKSLNLFLANGDVSFFEEIKQDSIFRLVEFINFISKPFAIRFDRALFDAFLDGNDIKVRKILSTSHLISPEDINISFKSVSNYLQSKIYETDKIADDIKKGRLVYNQIEIESLFSSIKEFFPAKTINCLPIYFSSQILKIANSINYLSNVIWSNLDLPNLSYKFTEYLLTLNISGVDKITFEKNLEFIGSENKKRSDKIKNAPLIKKWEDVVSFLDSLVIEIDAKKTKPNDAWRIAKSRIDLNDLNAIPEFGDYLRNQVCISIRNLSVSTWNHHNDIKTALEAISFAQLITISGDTKKKIDQDRKDLSELEEKYRGLLECHFCESSTPDDESKIEIRIYKINDRKDGQIFYKYLDVNVQRCNGCKKVHSKIIIMYWLYLLSGLTAGSLIWSAFNDLIVYGSVLGLFVGYILVKLKENKILKEFKTKDKSKSTLRRHPTIIQKLKEGWTLEEPGK
jgi:hypothetical protein